ncbi:MAG: LysM peptidoglycan-binding domain-containing protein [Lachnospiraceae bacterium]|nr:LysM peptidoglycan-binding domain-containing protein [Lachnospiraceae bacterium]
MKSKGDLRIHRNHIKRQRELRNHVLLFIGTFLMISVLTITFGSFLSKAKDANSEIPSYKYFKSIVIEQGDSLCSIAEANVNSAQEIDSYVSEVMHINSLDDTEIHAGQFIIVPYYSTEFK